MSYAQKIIGAVRRFAKPHPTEFDYNTLPWIDKKQPNIAEYVRQYVRATDLPYDLHEKLAFWRTNGYVVLEQAISSDWLSQLWQELETVIEHHDQYGLNVRVDLPDYKQRPVLPVRDVPRDVLHGPYIKFLDFHNMSVAGKRIMLHQNIVAFLEAVFSDRVVAMQSLLFKYGSQQATHQDFAYVVSEKPSHLAAAWIAMEDVQADAGPLYYYPGSQYIRKFNFGNGIFFNGESTRNPDDFANYLDALCTQKGLEKKTLLIKKGDVLLWHAALAHGGAPISNPALTRKSFVCHYSSDNAYRHHRQRPHEVPARWEHNGAHVFKNPNLLQEEDHFAEGTTW